MLHLEDELREQPGSLTGGRRSNMALAVDTDIGEVAILIPTTAQGRISANLQVLHRCLIRSFA
jgi:hypothetical protein